MKTICFSSLKGGSGKSSLSVLTANRLYRAGQRVLCVDMDIQNSLSYQLTKGMEPLELSRNSYQAFLDRSLEAQIQRHPTQPGPDFVISDLRLLDLQDRITPNSLSELTAGLADRYDFLIIDSAPTYNSLVAAAYCASDLLAVPVELSLFDLKSLHFLFAKVQDLGLARLAVRVLVNKFEAAPANRSLTDEYLSLLEGSYGPHVGKTRIPYSLHIRNHLDTGAPIPRGPVSRAVASMVAELTGVAA